MFQCLSAIQRLAGGKGGWGTGKQLEQEREQEEYKSKVRLLQNQQLKDDLEEESGSSPSCFITQGPILLLSFPDVGKGTETSKAAVYSVLQRQVDLGILPAFCPLPHAFLRLACETAEGAAIAGWILQTSLAAAQQREVLQHVSAMTILGSCFTGSVKSREECLPVQHFSNPREVTYHFNNIVISYIDMSMHSWAMPIFFLSLPWSLICLRSVQLNYFLNLFVDQFSCLMQTSGCWEQTLKICIEGRIQVHCHRNKFPERL